MVEIDTTRILSTNTNKKGTKKNSRKKSAFNAMDMLGMLG